MQTSTLWRSRQGNVNKSQFEARLGLSLTREAVRYIPSCSLESHLLALSVVSVTSDIYGSTNEHTVLKAATLLCNVVMTYERQARALFSC